MTTERRDGTPGDGTPGDGADHDEGLRDEGLRDEGLGDGDLVALFAEARRLQPLPSEALLARVLADAEAVSLARAAPAGSAAAGGAGGASGASGATGGASGGATGGAAGPGWLRGLAEVLGGWPALGGLLASTVLGLGLGLAQPAALSGLTASLWGDGVSVPLGLDEDPLGVLEASLGGPTSAPAPAPAPAPTTASTPMDG